MTAEFLEFELPNPENSINFEDVEAIKAAQEGQKVVDELKCGEEE